MKFVYPAIFHKTETNTYRASFPDLACCEAEAETLDDCIEKANEALMDWINLELSEEENCMLPPISDEDDLTLKEGEIVRNISVNIRFYDGWDE